MAKKRLNINQQRFSKEKLSIQYSPSNVEKLRKGLANSRVQILKRKGDFGTTPYKSNPKAYSNSPTGVHGNFQKVYKQPL